MNKMAKYDSPRVLSPVSESCMKFSMSRNTLVALAKECGAFIKIGRMVKIDDEKLLNHIRQKYTG